MKQSRYLKNYSLFFFILFLFGCSAKPSNEIIDIKDVLPTSKNYAEEKLKDTTQVFQKSEHTHDSFSLLDTVLYEQFPQLKPILNLTPDRLFVDRLRPVSKVNKTILIDSVGVEFVIWEFQDSIQTENAFFNWLDNFGKSQDAIRVGDTFRYKESGNYIYVGLQKIVYVFSNELFDFTPFQSLIESVYGINWKYCVHQQKGKRAKWLVLPEDVKNSKL